MRELIVDPELRDFLEATHPTNDWLESQLIADGGPRDAIVVWKGHDKILDGHRRYEICRKCDLPFRVVEVEVEDMNSAKRWMWENQDGRRNWTTHQRGVALNSLRKVNQQEVSMGANILTAEQAGVSVRTVIRSEVYGKLDKDVRNKIVAGDVQASQKDVSELAALDKTVQRGLVADVEAGEFKSLRVALRGEEDEKPRSPKRTTPAKAGLFGDAERLLGQLKKAVDKCGTQKPAEEYKRIMGLLDTVDSNLRKWQKA